MDLYTIKWIYISSKTSVESPEAASESGTKLSALLVKLVQCSLTNLSILSEILRRLESEDQIQKVYHEDLVHW